MRVAGVDGCPAGWYVAIWDRAKARVEGNTIRDFRHVLTATEDCGAIAVDIPIGLANSGPRDVDGQARRLLGQRASTVFPAPIRGMLAAGNRQEADRIRRSVDGTGVGYQAYSLVGKVRQVDELMTPELQSRVVEAHPELCFLSLLGVGAHPPKRTSAGYGLRLAALHEVLPDISHVLTPPRSRAAPDDVLDALVCAWTAARIADGIASRLPENPPLDRRGIRMEMWY